MLRNEFSVLFRRRRIQVLLFVLGLLPVIIMVALRYSGGPDEGDGPAFFNQVTHNGVFAALAALTVSFPVFLPMAVAIVAGDSISGEGSLGTLRYLLIRPVERTRLLYTKAIVTATFCLVATMTVAVSGLIAGLFLFPVGRVTTLSGDTISFASGALRIAGAALLIGVSLLGLAAIGLFISTLTDVPVGAMAATLGIFILVGVINALSQLQGLHTWMFTNDWQSFGDLLRTNIQWAGIRHNLIRQGLYVLIFGSAAWANFTTKDVLA